MPLFAPFDFIAFLRGETKHSTEDLKGSWMKFLSAEGESEFTAITNDNGSPRLFLNKPILLQASIKRADIVENWVITCSTGRAPHIAGGILEDSGSSTSRFSPTQIRKMIDDRLADITFEFGEGEKGIISGRAAPFYLNAKLDQIGRVKGRFKEKGEATQSKPFRTLLECLEGSQLGSEFLSFESPREDRVMATTLLELEKVAENRFADALNAMLTSFDIPLRKWRKLTRF